MKISMPYGKGQVDVEIPDANVIAVATPPSPIPAAEDEAMEIQSALANPIGSPRLREVAKGKKTAAIIVSDYTRPTPSSKLVPPLIEELLAGGMPLEGITVVFAAGAHRVTRPDEMRAILGEETYARVKSESHDCDAPDLVYVGTTKVHCTPVWMNRTVVESELRISVSCIEPHQGAGWSGSAKNILPGVCGRKTIMNHHSMLTWPEVRIGDADDNPFRKDLEEAAALVGLEFILAVILTTKKQISRAFAGDWIKAHREGVRVADGMLSFYLQEPSDIVLASVGGAPRDGNWWQTDGKGFTRIHPAIRDGGIVIMLSECSEGVGHPELEQALLGGTPDEIIERFKDAEFSVPNNKAFRLAAMLKKADVYLVTSGVTAETFGKLPVRIFDNADAALAAAFDKMGPSAKVVVVPRTPGILLRGK